VFEQRTIMVLNEFPHQLVVSNKRGPHRVRISFSPLGGPLDVGEQKGDDSRRRVHNGSLVSGS
jgi:hypothetical protein